MIRIVDWTQRNKARLNHCRKVRLDRGLDPMAPVVLDGYSATSSPGVPFLKFADAVGLRNAEALWGRVNEYCASHCAQTGEIRVPRAEFGRSVLSRGTDPISRSFGERIYDALVESGLAQALTDVVGAGPVPTQKKRRAVTGDGTSERAVSAQRDGTRRDVVSAQAPPGDVSCDGTSAVLVSAQAAGLAGAPARDTRTQGARKAHGTRAHLARESSSLEGPFCADTGDAPDQTRPNKASTQPVSVGRLEFGLRGITFDRTDARRAQAKALLDREHDDAWIAEAGALLATPRRTATAFVGVGA